MGRRAINGFHEAIFARLDHFCGIYGALSAGRLASRSPAFRFSLGKQTARKYNSYKMSLNCLQEHRDIKIAQCKHKVSHLYLNKKLKTT